MAPVFHKMLSQLLDARDVWCLIKQLSGAGKRKTGVELKSFRQGVLSMDRMLLK